MDRGSWQAIVHGVTKSQTGLSDYPALVGGFLPPVPPGKPREQVYTATVSTCRLEAVQMPAVLGSAAFL